MKEIIVTITDQDGLVLFETSPAQIKKELEMDDFPGEYQIRVGDILDAVEAELELPLYNS